jgi:predicted nucleotidyltransferase component of viral defense system
MVEWLVLSPESKRQTLIETAVATGFQEKAIEKDWWVTLILQACFLTQWKKDLVFKGGTSLTKAWGLIERFSEDIDLVMNREVLGFKGELSNTQIKRLREKTSEFMATAFMDSLSRSLTEMGVDPKLYKLEVQPGGVADRDPQILELYYHSFLDTDDYLTEKVIIEIGARSLMEPASNRTIQTIIGTALPNRPFSDTPFEVLTVDPRRTFLEKVFLLHEEFSKPRERMRHERMSRHLYDLEKLMDTEFGRDAINDRQLYEKIVQHRAKYTAIRGIDYSNHAPHRLDFLPPDEVQANWERDYGQMQRAMIYGKSLSYVALIQRLEELKQRFRNIDW